MPRQIATNGPLYRHGDGMLDVDPRAEERAQADRENQVWRVNWISKSTLALRS